MKIGVIGLGYVGLPLAVEFLEAGHEVVGVDIDQRRAQAIGGGVSDIEDIPSERLAAVSEKLTASTRYADLAGVEAAIIAVPTPLSRNREPDLGPLVSAGRSLAEVLQRGQLVVLESTTYPGTTRERLVPLLEESGLAAGVDFNVAFSPERVDPGGPITRFATPRRWSAASPTPAWSGRWSSTATSAISSCRCRRRTPPR
jgi:UDP-N-acetyl-D-glucosamine dehydrogenase